MLGAASRRAKREAAAAARHHSEEHAGEADYSATGKKKKKWCCCGKKKVEVEQLETKQVAAEQVEDVEEEEEVAAPEPAEPPGHCCSYCQAAQHESLPWACPTCGTFSLCEECTLGPHIRNHETEHLPPRIRDIRRSLHSRVQAVQRAQLLLHHA